MNRRFFITVSMLFLAASPTMADVINGGTSVNANGTLYQDYSGGGSTPLSAIPGMNTVGWNAATGLGTLTYTDTGSGTRYFDFFVNLDLGTAFWNEYGASNGALLSGERFQIDVPDFDCDANRCGNIIQNTNANVLDNLNHVPGLADNFNLDCGADGGGSVMATCNNDVSLALSFAYTVPVGDEAVLAFTISQTAPSSGFYLRQTKPLDGDNDPESVFFSGSVSIQPTAPVPEPGTLMLLCAGMLGAKLGYRKRTDVHSFDEH